MNWRAIQRTNFTDWKELALFLELDAAAQAQILTTTRFPLNLPLRLAQKIKKGTLDDPILKQFLPRLEEKEERPGFLLDPVGDNKVRRGQKLLHKYSGRTLLVTTGACAMNCRFCFRQNFDYETEDKTFDRELQMIAEDPSLSEILLSGGDPLSLSNKTLEKLIQGIAKIPHVKRIRFHSRFPLGIPERIDTEFLKILEETPLQFIFVLHCNHAQEFDEEIFVALKKLQCLGIPLLTQSVLLRGVNDDLDTLKTLFEKLVDHGILPYYLHQLDRVRGTAHFEVEEAKGKELIAALRKVLPGFAIPEYVREIAGEPSKTLL